MAYLKQPKEISVPTNCERCNTSKWWSILIRLGMGWPGNRLYLCMECRRAVVAGTEVKL